MFAKHRSRGLTLIELIVFIVIVGVALAGSLTVLNITTKASADPLVRKQALALAESLLEEAMLQPFTWCDPDDAQAATAVSNAVGATGCTSAATVEGLGAEGGETRASATTPFDNVSDYHALSTNLNIEGGGTAPAGVSAVVSVAAAALNDIASANALLVTVTVTAGSETIQLHGYRARYAPNSLP